MAWGDLNLPASELCGFHDRVYLPGDMLTLSLTTLDRSNSALQPTTSPTYQIFDASGNQLVAVTKMPIHNRYAYGSTVRGYFQHSILIDSLFSTGSNMILYRYTISGVTYMVAESFYVLAGDPGDDDGQVLSMGRVSRPEADYVLYRSRGGTEAAGMNPN